MLVTLAADWDVIFDGAFMRWTTMDGYALDFALDPRYQTIVGRVEGDWVKLPPNWTAS